MIRLQLPIGSAGAAGSKARKPPHPYPLLPMAAACLISAARALALHSSVQTSAPVQDERRKPRGEVIKYSREFLMKFAEVGGLGAVAGGGSAKAAAAPASRHVQQQLHESAAGSLQTLQMHKLGASIVAMLELIYCYCHAAAGLVTPVAALPAFRARSGAPRHRLSCRCRTWTSC